MTLLSLPRPGAQASAPQAPIAAPSEAHFTQTFGQLLPPASFLTTPQGTAAFYELAPPTGPSAPPAADGVLLIHGVQTPALGMWPLARALQGSFPTRRFCLVDLWGHGLSETPVQAHEPALFHALVDAVLDRLGWPAAHVVGYSFGGALAVGYADSRPARVRSLALVAPAGLIPSAGLGGLAALRGDDPAAAWAWTLDFLEGGELVVPPDWRARVARGEVVAPAVREWQMREHAGHKAAVVAIVRDGRIMDDDEAFARVAKSGVPAVGVVGALDPVCSGEQLRAVGFANVVVVHEAGHGVVRENAAEVAAAIEAFWKGLSAKSS
ncbi:hypothetical protein MCOR27_007636 [Pyricularia oryzae]|uniref:AB hydrolase-1 domain-containing protein n=3 Tax=Pyricularia TaxID=48558 RepID=A0ABQ8NRM7_PYRGI|nr:hypothetical protein MCOR01_002557 [Pyricularia oryzae]KAI6300973.1 hypothetical protein MCOR33_003454 [Pyricularia grisea]KAH9428834.1 hypothetical protein MCOR02_010256 [Pyricularia oryzae]KAI6255490.1 hypothetical protein MCOR19_007995 [Pyricularia oryzae]KAI6273885.1 hypothetical protein MCOR27_007636 [Pyricularia oryzae]